MQDTRYTQQELLEIAMVLQNMKDQIDKFPVTETDPEITFIRLQADFRNNENEYYNALVPFLDFVDHEEGNKVEGMNVDLREIESNALKIIRKQLVLTGEVITKIRKVPDPLGFGTLEDEAISYKMGVDIKKFENLYEQIVGQIEIEAELSFVNMSIPLIDANGHSYRLTTMRVGKAFDIIKYCMDNAANKEVTLDMLKSVLALEGVSNINETLKNSHFDKHNGLLRHFAQTTSKTITLKPFTILPKFALEAIILNSK